MSIGRPPVKPAERHSAWWYVLAAKGASRACSQSGLRAAATCGQSSVQHTRFLMIRPAMRLHRVSTRAYCWFPLLNKSVGRLLCSLHDAAARALAPPLLSLLRVPRASIATMQRRTGDVCAVGQQLQGGRVAQQRVAELLQLWRRPRQPRLLRPRAGRHRPAQAGGQRLMSGQQGRSTRRTAACRDGCRQACGRIGQGAPAGDAGPCALSSKQQVLCDTSWSRQVGEAGRRTPRWSGRGWGRRRPSTRAPTRRPPSRAPPLQGNEILSSHNDWNAPANPLVRSTALPIGMQSHSPQDSPQGKAPCVAQPATPRRLQRQWECCSTYLGRTGKKMAAGKAPGGHPAAGWRRRAASC